MYLQQQIKKIVLKNEHADSLIERANEYTNSFSCDHELCMRVHYVYAHIRVSILWADECECVICLIGFDCCLVRACVSVFTYMIMCTYNIYMRMHVCMCVSIVRCVL